MEDPTVTPPWLCSGDTILLVLRPDIWKGKSPAAPSLSLPCAGERSRVGLPRRPPQVGHRPELEKGLRKGQEPG